MKIIDFNFTNKQTMYKKDTNSSVPFFGLKLNLLNTDIVSFGAKPKKEGHLYHPNANKPHNQKSAFEKSCERGNKNSSKLRRKMQNSSQGFEPAQIQAKKLEKKKAKEEAQQKEVEAKLAYEHKKAELRKKYIAPSLLTRIKEQIISDREIDFILNKIKNYPELVSETFLEPDDGTLLFALSDNMMQKVLTETNDYNVLMRLVTNPDKYEKIFMEKIPDNKLKAFNEGLKQNPTVLISAYLTPNKNNQLPAHYLSIDGLKMMNEIFKEYPALIAQIYTHTDKNGNTPMHNRFRTGQQVIIDALKYQPETIAKIRKIKNKYYEYPETIMKKTEKYSGPYEETWKIILNDF